MVMIGSVVDSTFLRNSDMRARLLFCGLLLPLIQACSIHPLQQDVTHLRTVDLVNRIRCEARTALEDKIITLMQEHRHTDFDPTITDLINHRGHFRTFVKDVKNILKDEMEFKFYNEYIHYAIAFNFTFDITEENKASTQIDFLKPLTGGTFSLSSSNSGDFVRNNQRNFILSEDFSKLLSDTIMDCDGAVFTPNYAYPISGAIGLKELIDTFVDLNRDQKLQKEPTTYVFADTLTFTTTLMASLGPKGAFVLAGRDFQVMDASLTGLAMRMDKHQVIVGLSLPVDEKKTPAAAAVTPLLGVRSAQPSGTSAAQRAAVDATINQRLNTFLERFGDVVIRQ